MARYISVTNEIFEKITKLKEEYQKSNPKHITPSFVIRKALKKSKMWDD